MSDWFNPANDGEAQILAIGAKRERERIIKLLEDSFFPLDYPRWQADELMEEIFRLIKEESE